MFTVNRNPTGDDLRKFGRAMLIGFGVIGALLWIAGARRSGGPLLIWAGTSAQITAVVFAFLGAALFALSMALPATTRTVYVAWMSVTVAIGIAVSAVLLTILFVLVLPVFALIVQLGDPLRRKLGGATYWEDYKPHEPTLERMKRQF